VGGCDPYGGGLLHWWNPHCFPSGGAPDNYCRKPLPKVCWPPYPPYYIWGPPEITAPEANCPRTLFFEHQPITRDTLQPRNGEK
jgi:hypothetical protein